MAIGTDAAINFYGTPVKLGNTTSAVVSTEWSDGTNDLDLWTNSDDAPQAAVTFEGTLGSAAAAGLYIDLYVRKMNTIDTTDDDSLINDEFKHQYLGSFPMDEDTAQRYTLQIAVPNYKTSSEFEFYINNKSGQSLSSGWELQITPVTVGPHA